MSLFKLHCSWPDCEVSGYSGFSDRRVTTYFDTGRCSKHGKWAACSKHERHSYAEIDGSKCPVCRFEHPRVQDPLEARRRNAAEDAARTRRLSGYVAEFCAQGYGEVAAEAMANKRLREDGPPLRKWTADDIKYERESAERQRKIDAGELMRCPSCKCHVPVSQGVILSHTKVLNYGGGDRDYVPCDGEGMLVERDPS